MNRQTYERIDDTSSVGEIAPHVNFHHRDWRLRFLPSTGSLVLFFGIVAILTSMGQIGDTYRVITDIYVHDLFSNGLVLSPLAQPPCAGTPSNTTQGDPTPPVQNHMTCASVFGCAATLCRAVKQYGPQMNLTFEPSTDDGGSHGHVVRSSPKKLQNLGFANQDICTSHENRAKIDHVFHVCIVLSAVSVALGVCICLTALLFWCMPNLVHPTRVTHRRLRIVTWVMGIMGFGAIMLQLGIFVYHWRLRQHANLTNEPTRQSPQPTTFRSTPPLPTLRTFTTGPTTSPHSDSPHTIDNEWDILLYWFYGNINLIISNVIRTAVLVVFHIMTLVHYNYTYALNQEIISQQEASITETFGVAYASKTSRRDPFLYRQIPSASSSQGGNRDIDQRSLDAHSHIGSIVGVDSDRSVDTYHSEDGVRPYSYRDGTQWAPHTPNSPSLPPRMAHVSSHTMDMEEDADDDHVRTMSKAGAIVSFASDTSDEDFVDFVRDYTTSDTR